MTEEKQMALATEEIALQPIADDSLVSIADTAEKRIDAMHRIKTMALKLTNAHDWVDEGGKPYLQSSGAEKVARMFGVCWRVNEPTMDKEEGGHYTYTYTGEFSLGASTIDAVGTRSSKDPFFTKYEYGDIDPETNKKKRTKLPASEISRGDVKKSAYSNLLANGITRVLGIRNLTYEDLAKAGISKDTITSIEYKKAGDSSSKAPKDPNAPATDPQINAIKKKLDMAGITDDMERCEKVSTLAGIDKPITDINSKNLTKSQASNVIERMNKGE